MFPPIYVFFIEIEPFLNSFSVYLGLSSSVQEESSSNKVIIDNGQIYFKPYIIPIVLGIFSLILSIYYFLPKLNIFSYLTNPSLLFQ